jgi:predicted aspartyl protease
MEIETMGRVLTEATIEKLEDLLKSRSGQISDSQVRRITVSDALVDTGARSLALPKRLVQQLGLQKRCTKRVTSTTGLGEAAMCDAVRLTIQGRDCPVDVREVDDTVPVLIGKIPREMLDLVADLQSRRLMGNREHGGEHIIELL